MQPLFFEPVYKDYIWGGNNIEKYFNRKVNNISKIAESWELSAHENGLSIVKNGEFKGKTLLELFENLNIKKEIFGLNCEKLDKFPILVKFIDATDKLSIQVHPDDEYANKYENDSGKTEVWYVLDCKKNAKIIYGLKEESKNKKNVEIVNNIEDNVCYKDVKKGDFITIPAGTVHAILDGILICEIQQSSDVTYRVYDWNRVGKDGKSRQLHKEQAIDVIRNGEIVPILNFNNITDEENAFKSKYFNIDILNIQNERKMKSNKYSFSAYMVIEGSGAIEAEDYKSNITIGQTFLIPANLGEYKIIGKIKLIKVSL